MSVWHLPGDAFLHHQTTPKGIPSLTKDPIHMATGKNGGGAGGSL